MTDKEIKIGTIIISRGASFTTKHLEEISRQFKRLEAENAELKAENEIILNRLTQYEEDADIQVCLFSDVKRLEQENAELKAENVRLREKFNNLISTPIYENCNLLLEQKRRLEKCLQEIKVIAEENSPFIDNFEIKSATEVGYDYATICNELELRLHKVLELITQAEEE